MLGLLIYFGYSRHHSALRTEPIAAGTDPVKSLRCRAAQVPFEAVAMQTFEKGPRWYEGLSAGHWMVLAVASAGWVFDVYEGQLFTIFKTPMLTELTGGNPAAIEWQGNLGLAAFLLGGAAGGSFSAFSATGSAGSASWRTRSSSIRCSPRSRHSPVGLQVHVLRFLVALGAGGEWAIAAALVAETFPAHARAAARGSSTRRASWAVHLRR